MQRAEKGAQLHNVNSAILIPGNRNELSPLLDKTPTNTIE